MSRGSLKGLCTLGSLHWLCRNPTCLAQGRLEPESTRTFGGAKVAMFTTAGRVCSLYRYGLDWGSQGASWELVQHACQDL